MHTVAAPAFQLAAGAAAAAAAAVSMGEMGPNVGG